MNELFFKNIESDAFAAHLTLASNLRTFLWAARQRPEFQLLVTACALEGAEHLIERLDGLLRIEFDEDYRHPSDVAIAVYLYVLASMHEGFARDFARDVINDDRGCWWWALQMANQIIGQVTTNRSITFGNASWRTSSDAYSSRYLIRIPESRLALAAPVKQGGVLLQLPEIGV